ncbi:ARID DNA-binding domain-containing protein [Tanacetum coccineum]
MTKETPLRYGAGYTQEKLKYPEKRVHRIEAGATIMIEGTRYRNRERVHVDSRVYTLGGDVVTCHDFAEITQKIAYDRREWMSQVMAIYIFIDRINSRVGVWRSRGRSLIDPTGDILRRAGHVVFGLNPVQHWYQSEGSKSWGNPFHKQTQMGLTKRYLQRETPQRTLPWNNQRKRLSPENDIYGLEVMHDLYVGCKLFWLYGLFGGGVSVLSIMIDPKKECSLIQGLEDLNWDTNEVQDYLDEDYISMNETLYAIKPLVREEPMKTKMDEGGRDYAKKENPQGCDGIESEGSKSWGNTVHKQTQMGHKEISAKRNSSENVAVEQSKEKIMPKKYKRYERARVRARGLVSKLKELEHYKKVLDLISWRWEYSKEVETKARTKARALSLGGIQFINKHRWVTKRYLQRETPQRTLPWNNQRKRLSPESKEMLRRKVKEIEAYNTSKMHASSKKNGEGSANTTKEKRARCYICRKRGHAIWKCPNKKNKTIVEVPAKDNTTRNPLLCGLKKKLKNSPERVQDNRAT